MTSYDGVIISQGAEAVIYRSTFMGRECVIKQRRIKRFRHPQIDEQLTKNRMVAEARTTLKLRRAGVYVPLIYLVNFLNREIIYEYIPGVNVVDVKEKADELFIKIGETIAKIHNANVIHGDLTTKNMILSQHGLITLIDFGLSFTSTLVEDKAVDLYVLERCCASEEFKCVLVGYSRCINNESILAKLNEVRQRGRKRNLAG